ncbi:STAS domain-containing protein [Streptomyces pilosus]
MRDGDRVRVTVRGELDFEAQDLRYELHEALRSSDTGVDLDLSAVSFCDCSGLNVLLDARQRALGQGKTVALRASSPAVERLLGLIGAQDLFAPPTVDASATGTTGHRHADPWDGERARGEAAPLRQVVRSRWKAAVTTSDAAAPVAVGRARVPAGSG